MLEQEGRIRVIHAVGIKRHPPTFSRFRAFADPWSRARLQAELRLIVRQQGGQISAHAEALST